MTLKEAIAAEQDARTRYERLMRVAEEAGERWLEAKDRLKEVEARELKKLRGEHCAV